MAQLYSTYFTLIDPSTLAVKGTATLATGGNTPRNQKALTVDQIGNNVWASSSDGNNNIALSSSQTTTIKNIKIRAVRIGEKIIFYFSDTGNMNLLFSSRKKV